jgi:REP element-mobilizing transposase RayT
MARPRRIPGYPYIGVQRYFITVCTHNRAEHFRNLDAAALVVDAFIETARQHAVTIVVYCVMPDHMHLLLDGDHDGADLPSFMRVAKQRAGFRFKQRFGCPLWQEGYYEHVLRNEERTEDVVFYVIANPTRKRLVEHVREYPLWGSMRYSREELLQAIGIRRS